MNVTSFAISNGKKTLVVECEYLKTRTRIYFYNRRYYFPLVGEVTLPKSKADKYTIKDFILLAEELKLF